ncbi:MAG: hypothetical protein GY809_11510 [Planctomycetes bacterium]|nr:hypothetical protein [Planctomycetota bacterium]
MINELNNNQVSDGALNARTGVLGAAQTVNQNASQQVGTRNSTDNTQDASLKVSFGSLIEQAKQAPAEDGSAVARAKALIASGQLDTPENIQKAVQNILKYGV